MKDGILPDIGYWNIIGYWNMILDIGILDIGGIGLIDTLRHQQADHDGSQPNTSIKGYTLWDDLELKDLYDTIPSSWLTTYYYEQSQQLGLSLDYYTIRANIFI